MSTSAAFERSTVTVHHAPSAADYLLLFFALWLGTVAVGAAVSERRRVHEVPALSSCRDERSPACQEASPTLAAGPSPAAVYEARLYFWFSHYFPRAVLPSEPTTYHLDPDWGDLDEETEQFVLQILRDENRRLGVSVRLVSQPSSELPSRQETWFDLLESGFGRELLGMPQEGAPAQGDVELAAAYRAAIGSRVVDDLERYDTLIQQAWAGVAARRAGPLWTRYPFALVAAGTSLGALLVAGLALWRRRDPIPIVASSHALCIGEQRILWEDLASISVEADRIAWTTVDERQDAAEGLRISPQAASAVRELIALCMQPREPLNAEALQQIAALRSPDRSSEA